MEEKVSPERASFSPGAPISLESPDPLSEFLGLFHNNTLKFLDRRCFDCAMHQNVYFKRGPKSSGKSGSKMEILFSVVVCFGRKSLQISEEKVN